MPQHTDMWWTSSYPKNLTSYLFIYIYMNRIFICEYIVSGCAEQSVNGEKFDFVWWSCGCWDRMPCHITIMCDICWVHGVVWLALQEVIALQDESWSSFVDTGCFRHKSLRSSRRWFDFGIYLEHQLKHRGFQKFYRKKNKFWVPSISLKGQTNFVDFRLFFVCYLCQTKYLYLVLPIIQ